MFTHISWGFLPLKILRKSGRRFRFIRELEFSGKRTLEYPRAVVSASASNDRAEAGQSSAETKRVCISGGQSI